MKIVMSYWTKKPGKNIVVFSPRQELNKPVEVSYSFEYDSPEKALGIFEARLTKCIKLLIDTGDCITFNFFDLQIYIPDFYPHSKYEEYSEERWSMPYFESLDDWFDSKRIDAEHYDGMQKGLSCDGQRTKI